MTIAGRIRHLTRIGLSHMNEAVLDVLFHAYGKPAGLTAAQIHERMGLGEDFGNPPYGIVEGLLSHLEGAGSVTSRSTRGPHGEVTWRLNDLEYAQRRD